MQKLNTFWLHSNCPAKFKLIAADAVIRTKILYGFDSAKLGETELKRIDTIQLNIFRKILGLKTTFVNRENDNNKIWKDVNEKVTAEGKKKRIISFRKAYKKARLKTIATIIHNDTDLRNQVTFEKNIEERIYPNRRVGRPKETWATAAVKELWEGIRNRNPRWRYTTLNTENTDIIHEIKETSKHIYENKF